MAKQRRGYRIDMVNGPLAGKILFFALPLMASSLLQLLFNAADIVVVGRFVGKEALAAVGSNGSLVNLLVNLFMGFSVGANVVVAQDLGGGREEDVRKSVHTAITLSLLSGLALTLIGATLARQLVELISSPEDVIDLATVYLRIYFFGMPANMLYNFGAAILRSQGDTQRPLYYLTIAGVVNVLLNLFFVVVLQISVAGVALATIISQYISAGLVLLCMLHEPGALHLDLRSLGIDKDVVRRICRVGLPAGFQGIVFSLSNVVIQGSINSFNSTAIVAGSSAASNIEGFVYVCPSSFYQAALTFTSQNYGAGKCGRVDRILLLTQIYGMTSAAVLGLLAYGFGAPLASIYAPGEPEVIEWAVVRMGYICRFYFICGAMDTMVGILRGLGYSVVPMVVSMLGACGTRLLWIATVFQMPQFHTPQVLFLSYPISWLITAATHFTVFLVVRKRAYARAAARLEEQAG